MLSTWLKNRHKELTKVLMVDSMLEKSSWWSTHLSLISEKLNADSTVKVLATVRFAIVY